MATDEMKRIKAIEQKQEDEHRVLSAALGRREELEEKAGNEDFQAMEQTQIDLRKTCTMIQGRVDALEALDLDKLTRIIVALGKRVETQSTILAELGERQPPEELELLPGVVGTLQTEIQETMSQLRQRITDVETSLDTGEERLSALEFEKAGK